MSLIIASAAGITIFIVLLLILLKPSGAKVKTKQRIDSYMDLQPLSEGGIPVGAHLPSAAQMSGLRGFIRDVSKYFEWAQLSRTVGHKLLQAGLPLRGSEFMVICLGAAILGILLMALLSGGSFVWIFVGGSSGYLTPLLVLKIKIARRAKAFNNQLGDSLTLIANSLRTGYSFMQAIEMVSKEMPAPISVEFARVLREMNLGVTTEDALNNLAKRVDSNDLDMVVTAVLIQRQVGGNLAEVLDNISGTIRQRVKLRGEIKSLTAQGRISGIIIGFLPFVLGLAMFIINPSYIKTLFTHPVGIMMVMIALCSQVVGIIWVRKIVNIEL